MLAQSEYSPNDEVLRQQTDGTYSCRLATPPLASTWSLEVAWITTMSVELMDGLQPLRAVDTGSHLDIGGFPPRAGQGTGLRNPGGCSGPWINSRSLRGEMNRPWWLSRVPLCDRDTMSTFRAHGVPVGSTSHGTNGRSIPNRPRPASRQSRLLNVRGCGPRWRERMTVRVGGFGSAFRGLTMSSQRSRTRRTEQDGQPGASPSRSTILAAATII